MKLQKQKAINKTNEIELSLDHYQITLHGLLPLENFRKNPKPIMILESPKMRPIISL